MSSTARADMAVVRGSLTDCPVVLVSATPSLETVTNVAEERYARVHLPNRHGVAEMPHIEVLDMRASAPPRGHWLAPPLTQALAETVAGGEQAMLFLNRPRLRPAHVMPQLRPPPRMSALLGVAG